MRLCHVFVKSSLFLWFEIGMTPSHLGSAADKNRVLWKTFNACQATSVMQEQVGQELLAATGLGKALGITYSKPVVPEVIDFVLGFNAEKKCSSFRGRTINLTPTTLRSAFQLPSRETCSAHKQVGSPPVVKRMFTREPCAPNPYSMAQLVGSLQSWIPMLRLVQETLMGKSKPTQLHGKDLWFIVSHCWKILPDSVTSSEIAPPSPLPDWALLMCYHLRREIAALRSHILKGIVFSLESWLLRLCNVAPNDKQGWSAVHNHMNFG